MNFTLRTVDPASPSELHETVALSMLTIWETLPEARKAPSVIPNFSFDAMRAMYQRTLTSPLHRHLICLNNQTDIVGHGIFIVRPGKRPSLQNDLPAENKGECFTAYVLPPFRRLGLAKKILEAGMTWFETQKVGQVTASTHSSNQPLRQLARSCGFQEEHRPSKNWDAIQLVRCLL